MGEPDDVMLHVNFDPVDGISKNGIAFNEAAKGSAVSLVTTNSLPMLPTLVFDNLPTDEVRGSLIAETAKANTGCMTNVYKKLAATYYKWLPPDDSFTNKSFTVECFYKTREKHDYHYLVRRRVTGATQFSLHLHIEMGTGCQEIGS